MCKIIKTHIQICSLNGSPGTGRGNGKRGDGVTPINLPIFLRNRGIEENGSIFPKSYMESTEFYYLPPPDCMC